jgi:hypothetical protein
VESPLPNLTFGAASMQKNLPHHFYDVDFCLRLERKSCEWFGRHLPI